MGFHSLYIKHAPAVVLISRQWSEHGFIWPYKETIGGSCSHFKTLWRLLSFPHDNGLSMVLHGPDIKHATAIVVLSWQWSEHGFIWPHKETYSGCHPHLMTTVWIWFICPYLKTMVEASTEHGLYGRIKNRVATAAVLTSMVWAWYYIAPISNMRRLLS